MQEEIEIWEDLIYKGVDYTGYYQVSNKAKIKSLGRTAIFKNGRKKFYPERILKPSLSDGYLTTAISKNGVATTIKISRAVATAFIPNPENKPCVNHIDCNRGNDSPSNLEWVTYSENTLHAVKSGNWIQARQRTRGGSNYSSGLTEKQVVEIKAIQKQKTISDSKLGRIYGVSNVAIHKIRHGISWKHI